MSYLFITHGIKTVAYICDRLIIFNNGQIVEETAVQDLNKLKEDYSKKLLDAILPF